MAKRKVDGLSFKAGPTESGIPSSPPPSTPPPTSIPVGGEVVGIDAIAVFLSKYWPLIVLLMVPVVYALYKKRSAMPKWFLRLMYFLRGL
ncbi:MAG: hypothetical protein ACE14S_11265 [Candidatus Bathyarchaeia archaeon]